GQALAVDRDIFARTITERIAQHPAITLERGETTSLPDGPAVIATGPLTSDSLTREIAALLGDEGLAFYDSIAPIISNDSIDTSIAFFASRWDKGGDEDYLNCPMSKDEYEAFIAAIRSADVYPGHEWEDLPHTRDEAPPAVTDNTIPYFEGCLPIEVMVER